MGSLRLTLCSTVLAVAALTPAAHATDGDSVTVTPSSPAPGADVALRVNGCAVKSATATSAAFVTDARLTGSGGTLAGETRVRTSIRAGSYDVRISCADLQVKDRITVGHSGSAGSSAQASPSAQAAPPAHASPVAPVPAGGGGTATLSASQDARAAGPGTAQGVTGLVLVGVAAVAVALLGSRRSRRTG
ncbi:hypothetical protein ABZ027_32625 [Streptomyces sp. NPDC006332]|uniref:hypothetical protein n=1 Tax=Streptomyces sp. NPDC006332 TaxID=3155456 RepID=UPI0033ABBFF0